MPSSSGSYALRITDGTCSITSSCIDVLISTAETKQPDQIRIFPNPTNGLLFIQNAVPNTRLRITDVMGRSVLDRILDSGSPAIDLATYESGVYLILLLDENGMTIAERKIVLD